MVHSSRPGVASNEARAVIPDRAGGVLNLNDVDVPLASLPPTFGHSLMQCYASRKAEIVSHITSMARVYAGPSSPHQNVLH